MNISVENGDVNVDYCYINTSTGSESKNHKYIDYTKKRDEIYNKKYIIDYRMV